ncbi:MAG: J domain-containing protein [Bdellovibrionales bacterium]|nr:J domain-containing protein [Bdellovibrionales bacterium]
MDEDRSFREILLEKMELSEKPISLDKKAKPERLETLYIPYLRMGNHHLQSSSPRLHPYSRLNTRPQPLHTRREGVLPVNSRVMSPAAKVSDEPIPQQSSPLQPEISLNLDQLSLDTWVECEIFRRLGAELTSPLTLKDLKSNFRRLALKYHPDKGGCSETFSSLQTAYQRLSQLF